MNRNRILVVRGDSAALVAKVTQNEDELAYGQPVFTNDKNYLTIGGKNKKFYKVSKPVTVREVVGYFDDNKEITANVTQPYHIQPTNNELEISSSKDILVKVNDNAYIRVNEVEHLIEGLVKAENLKVKSVNGNGNITILKNGSFTFTNNRKLLQNDHITFGSNAGIKSKFVVYGADNANNNVTIDGSNTEGFFINTGTALFKNTVTADKNMTVKGDMTLEAMLYAPTIHTSTDSLRVEIAHNSGSPYLKLIKGSTDIFAVTAEGGVVSNKLLTGNKIKVTSELDMTASAAVAKIRKATITDLTVTNLVIA